MFEVSTLWNAFSIFIGAGEIVNFQFDFKKSERYWNFILGNRNIFNNLNLKLAILIPAISSRILAQLALAHLIIAIITIAVALV
jgi:type IV secretory pathway VirB6-like protein